MSGLRPDPLTRATPTGNSRSFHFRPLNPCINSGGRSGVLDSMAFGRHDGWKSGLPSQHKYRALAAELTEVGFISPGSVVVRETSCGKPGFRCQGDPPQRHGPYYQWSRAIAGKTVSRRLNEPEAELYRQWIANRRRLERIVTEMETLSAAAGETFSVKRPNQRHPAACSIDQPWRMGGRSVIEKCGTSDSVGDVAQ